MVTIGSLELAFVGEVLLVRWLVRALTDVTRLRGGQLLAIHLRGRVEVERAVARGVDVGDVAGQHGVALAMKRHRRLQLVNGAKFVRHGCLYSKLRADPEIESGQPVSDQVGDHVGDLDATVRRPT